MKSILRRSFCMAFAVLIFLQPLGLVLRAAAAAEASAALHNSVVQEFIAAILARSGVEFKSSASLLSVAGMVWEDLQNVDVDEVAQQIEDFKQSLNPSRWNVDWDYTGQLANQMAIRVSPSMWQAICDSFNGLLDDSGSIKLPSGSVTLLQDKSNIDDVINQLSSVKLSALRYMDKDGVTHICTTNLDKSGRLCVDPYYPYDSLNYGTYGIDYMPSDFAPENYYISISSATNGRFLWSVYDRLTDNRLFAKVYTYPPCTFSFSLIDLTFMGDLAYPPDDTLVRVPDLPTVGADGAIVMPDIPVLPEDYIVTDLPDTAGKVITDLPYDVPIDIVTGDSVVSADVPDIPDVPVEVPSLWQWLADFLQSILDAILGIAANILQGISDLLSSLFVPSADFFQNNFNQIQELLALKLDVESYKTLMESLRTIEPDDLKNITVNLYGQELVILDFGVYKSVKPTVDNWLRGLMFIGLLIYNINNIYRLVRSGDISRADKFGALFSGGGGRKGDN